MVELSPEEKDFEYTLGNIILSNHIQLEKRIEMIREVMEIHGYAQLTKQEVCPECGGKKTSWLPENGNNNQVEKTCPTCQGTGKSRPDREKVFEAIYYHRFPNAVHYKFKPLLHDKWSEELTTKVIAIFDEEAIREDERERIAPKIATIIHFVLNRKFSSAQKMLAELHQTLKGE